MRLTSDSNQFPCTERMDNYLAETKTILQNLLLPFPVGVKSPLSIKIYEHGISENIRRLKVFDFV